MLCTDGPLHCMPAQMMAVSQGPRTGSDQQPDGLVLHVVVKVCFICVLMAIHDSDPMVKDCVLRGTVEGHNMPA
jgi:hypothetical protein